MFASQISIFVYLTGIKKVLEFSEGSTCGVGTLRSGVGGSLADTVQSRRVLLTNVYTWDMCLLYAGSSVTGEDTRHRMRAIRAKGARDVQSFDGMAKHPNERGGHTMTENDYAEMGIRFDTETVSKQRGDHASDRVELGNGQIAVVTDLEKFRAAFSDETVLGILDGTSIRVMSQDVSRRLLNKGTKKAEDIQAAIINRLRGVRNASGGGVRIVKVNLRNLPDGTQYEGDNETEYQQMYAAAL